VLRDFDIFEKFSDGSTVWRVRVFGRFETKRRLQELTEHSNNQFFAIDIQSGVPLPAINTQKPRLAMGKKANG
jgi:hypothetical protein